MTDVERKLIVGIEPEHKQVFRNKPTALVGYKEIIKMKNSGVITERDLEIAKFLFEFNFATASQINEYLKAFNEEMASTTEVIKKRLDKLVQYRVLNKFILVEDNDEDKKHYHDYSDDLLDIYCMDVGGRHLLANYSNIDTSNWFTVQTMKISEVVKRELFITEFYIQLYKTSGNKLVFFNVNPSMSVGRRSIVPSFEMCIEDKGKKSYFIGEVVLDIDLPGDFRSKSINIETLLKTNGWRKYYHDSEHPPPLLIVTESDYSALDASRLFYRMTDIAAFRVTTFDRMQEPFYENGVFMKYIDRVEEMEGVISSKFK